MKKPFWIPLIASLGTMILLYFIGYVANIDMLIFKISPSYIEIAFLPIVIGFIVGFVSERIVHLYLKYE